MNRGRVNIVSMTIFRFLETNIRDWKKYEKTIQTSVDNRVNDLHFEIKFENCGKEKNSFFIKRNIAFLFLNKNIFYSWRHIFFKIPKNLIFPAFFHFLFFADPDTKKHGYASAKTLNAALVKLTDWIIKNDHVINCVLFSCKW